MNALVAEWVVKAVRYNNFPNRTIFMLQLSVLFPTPSL